LLIDFGIARQIAICNQQSAISNLQFTFVTP